MANLISIILMILQLISVVPNAIPKNETTKPIEETVISQTTVEKEITIEEVKQYLKNICVEYEMDYALVCAIIQRESSWHYDSVSSGGHVGLMQIDVKIHKRTIEKLGCSDMKNPLENVKVGVHILASYGCEDVRHMIMCYSMGVGKANQLWAKGVHTTWYVEQVMEIKKNYEK